jgi:hypothetical protein
MKLTSRLVAILMLGVAAHSFGAVTLVNHTSAVSPNGANVTTPAINTTGANFIVVAASAIAANGRITDSNSNTWTALNQYGPFAVGTGMRLFYSFNPTVSSAQTFTFSDSTSVDYPAIAVAAFSGVSSLPFDAQNGSSFPASAGTFPTGSISPLANGELIISATGNCSSIPATVDSSLTIVETQSCVGGLAFGVSLAYLVQGVAAPVSPSWTIAQQHSVTNASFTVASFRSTGGGVALISGGTVALGTASVPAGGCAPAVTSSASGVAVTDTIIYNTSTDPTVVNGYRPSSSGSLYIWAFPAANNVSFVVCNPSAAPITPGALSLNWKVMR